MAIMEMQLDNLMLEKQEEYLENQKEERIRLLLLVEAEKKVLTGVNNLLSLSSNSGRTSLYISPVKLMVEQSNTLIMEYKEKIQDCNSLIDVLEKTVYDLKNNI